MKKLFLILFTLLSINLVSASFIFAEENSDIKSVSIMPKDGFKFVLKRFGEKAMLTLYSLFPGRKCQLYQNLLDSRLAELNSIAKEKDIANIETTSSRYSSTAGQLAELAVSKQLNDCKQSAREKMSKHIPILEQSRDGYDGATAEWRFIQNDINSLKTYIDNLK